jgi:hypothetical protein
MNIFLKTNKNELVLYVHTQIVFKILGCLVKEKNKYKFAVFLKKHLLILKVFQTPHNNFCSAFPSLSLVEFLHYYIYCGRLSEQFSGSQASIRKHKLPEEGYWKKFQRSKEKLYFGFSLLKGSQIL